MKKFISLVLVLALCVFVFAACGEKKDDNVLTMATNAEFPPYEFYEGEEVVGIDAEIAAAIAEKLGMELEIVDTAFDSIIPAIVAGKYDMGMAGMTVTDERLEEVNFSDSYSTGVQVVIVKKGSEIKTVDDLTADKKYTIGVQTGTTGDLYSTWDIEDEGLGTVSRFNKGADAVEALKIGKVDCVIIDNEPAKAFVAEAKILKSLRLHMLKSSTLSLFQRTTKSFLKISTRLSLTSQKMAQSRRLLTSTSALNNSSL